MKKLTLFVAASSLLTACSDNIESQSGAGFDNGIPKQGQTTNFDKQQLLIDLTEQVFLPTITGFETSSEQQLLAIKSYCNDLKTTGSESQELKSAAQSAWRAAMSDWQQLEVMQLGPLHDNDGALRNKIYSWPNPVNSCAVDQDVGHHEAGNISGTPYNIENRTNSRRGLDALEYLLFTNSIQHSCPNDSLAPRGWNDRPELERLIARCEFAVTAARDISNSAQQLSLAWTQDSGNQPSFSKLLTMQSSNTTNSKFADFDEAINHITDALFYVDKITKDAKIGQPIGLINNSCGSSECFVDIESRLSGHSLENIKANMTALLLVLEGTDPDNQTAFNDYLAAAEASGLATTMSNDINDVITFIGTFDDPFDVTVAYEPAKVQELYQKVKAVTDNLKSTFITILSLQLPASSAGDSD